jgi:hypothetical protein
MPIRSYGSLHTVQKTISDKSRISYKNKAQEQKLKSFGINPISLVYSPHGQL